MTRRLLWIRAGCALVVAIVIATGSVLCDEPVPVRVALTFGWIVLAIAAGADARRAL